MFIFTLEYSPRSILILTKVWVWIIFKIRLSPKVVQNGGQRWGNKQSGVRSAPGKFFYQNMRHHTKNVGKPHESPRRGAKTAGIKTKNSYKNSLPGGGGKCYKKLSGLGPKAPVFPCRFTAPLNQCQPWEVLEGDTHICGASKII